MCACVGVEQLLKIEMEKMKKKTNALAVKINRAKQLKIAANEGVANQWRSKAKWPGNYEG